MKQNTSKTRKLKVYIILFILGFICYCIGTFIHTSSYGSHDLSELEKTIGVMDYSVGRNNDGESVYKASATYFVDGEIYEWHAKFSVSSKPSSWMTGKKVEVYYDPLNPSDCVIPEIAHANVFIVDFFYSVGGVLMGVSAISFVIFLIKFVFFVGGLGIFAVVNRKNQKKYMGN